MAYHFTAETPSTPDIEALRERLAEADLVEYFPIEQNADGLSIGLSIPFKQVDDPRFAEQIESLMTYLVVEKGFEVVDLYTGEAVMPENIAGLAKQISG